MHECYFIPQYLKGLNNWILWKKELNEKGNETKVLYSANYHGRAKSDDSTTWCSYTSAARKLYSHEDTYNGIGIVLSPETKLVFIDIDHCVKDRSITQTALEIIKLFPDSYIELSQSGEGIHILTKGKIERNFNNRKEGVEMYFHKRFVALTGRCIQQKEPQFEQTSLDICFKKHATKKQNNISSDYTKHIVTMSEQEIIERASNSKNGAKFSSLFSGNWKAYFGSQSEADQSLCNILAFWCNRDIPTMDNIFRASGLYRKKWNRADYRNSTLNNAVLSCKTDYSEYKEGKELERTCQQQAIRERMLTALKGMNP